MTKKEHEALQKLFNEINEQREEADKAFKELQNRNATEGTGKRWCCAKDNALDLLSCGKNYMRIYDRYVAASAKEDMLHELGRTLAELDFWKKK